MSAIIGFLGLGFVAFCFGAGVGLGLRAGLRLFN